MTKPREECTKNTEYIRRLGKDYYKCDRYLSINHLSIIYPSIDQSINNSLKLSVCLSVLISTLLPVFLSIYSLVMIIILYYYIILYAKYSFSKPMSLKFYAVLWILQNLMFSFRKKQFVKHEAILTVNAACTIKMSGRCC